MKRIFLLALIAALLATPMAVFAQEPGSGGPVVEGNAGGSENIGTFNPLRCGNTACSRIWGLLFPTVVGASSFTQFYAPLGTDESVTQALATDWTISEDGLTYTFNLRDDAVWTDGEPITAEDVVFSFETIRSGQAETELYTGATDWDEVGNPSGIKEVRAIDDYTVEMEFGAASCSALGKAAFPVIPAHVFGWTADQAADFDYSTLIDNEFDTNPNVTSGFFQFASFTPGESIGLTNAEGYYDGETIPQGYIYRDVPDQNVLIEQFLAGDLNFVDTPSVSVREDLRNNPDVQTYEYPGNAWDYIGLNLADPSNPQPAFDESGAAVDQGHHPIFGDVRVRRAIQHGIDVQAIIEGAVFGEGEQMASATIPGSWSFDETLEPIPFDQEAAAALLDEAGWVLEGETRVCRGCMYAEDGDPLQFELLTNAGNNRREQAGVLIQDQLSELGIIVDYQAIDFFELLDITASQEFDAFLLGWRQGWPDDPDQTQLFSPSTDDPVNQGSNSGSYNNPAVVDLMIQADTVPGCDQAARSELYHEIQRLILEDQPYIFLYAIDGMYAARAEVEGFAPEPNTPLWNVNAWNVASAE